MRQPNPEPLPDWFAELLAEDDAPPAAPQSHSRTADPARLSVGELEVLLDEKRRSERQLRQRELRARLGTGTLSESRPSSVGEVFPQHLDHSTEKKSARDTPPTDSKALLDQPYVPPAIAASIAHEVNPPLADDDTFSNRFRSPALEPPKRGVEGAPPRRGRFDKLWFGLEVLVIVLCLGALAYWLLDLTGHPLDSFFSDPKPTGMAAHGDGRTVNVTGGRPLAIALPQSAATIVAPTSPTATQGVLEAPVLPTQADTAITTAADPTNAVVAAPTQPSSIVGTAAPATTGATRSSSTAVAPTQSRNVPTPASTPVVVAPAPIQPVPATNFLNQPATRIVIPKIGVDTGMKEVTININRWQVADFAAGHHRGTANPGETGNMVVAGHRDIRGSVFLKLPDLAPGDLIYYYTDAGRYTYTVTDTFIVLPNDISVMDYTDEPTTTLITCTPIALATRRFIVRGRLTETPTGKPAR